MKPRPIAPPSPVMQALRALEEQERRAAKKRESKEPKAKRPRPNGSRR